MDKIVGICGNCGGNVVLPDAYLSINPPVPRCNSCGAEAKRNLPIVEMQKKDEKKFLTES